MFYVQQISPPIYYRFLDNIDMSGGDRQAMYFAQKKCSFMSDN
jgi:hypothetical protein